MKTKVIIALMAVIMLSPILSLAGDVVIICNPSVKVSTLGKSDVNNIFLGRKSTWDDGTSIVFAIQKDLDVHKSFLDGFMDKTPSQFVLFWKKIVFTGKGSSPQTVDNDLEMIKFVGETKGAIGYVSAKAGLENVKNISVK